MVNLPIKITIRKIIWIIINLLLINRVKRKKDHIYLLMGHLHIRIILLAIKNLIKHLICLLILRIWNKVIRLLMFLSLDNPLISKSIKNMTYQMKIIIRMQKKIIINLCLSKGNRHINKTIKNSILIFIKRRNV